MGAENENALECGREGQSQGFRAEGSGALSILTDATGQPWENEQHPPVLLLPFETTPQLLRVFVEPE